MTMLLGEGEDVITILPKEHISGSASNPYEKITEKVNNVLRFRDSQLILRRSILS